MRRYLVLVLLAANLSLACNQLHRVKKLTNLRLIESVGVTKKADTAHKWLISAELRQIRSIADWSIFLLYGADYKLVKG